MGYLYAIILGYLLGCSNMAFYISLIKGVDIRSHGTGNLGASNATILLGWGAGVLVALHDGAKAFAAVLLAKWLLPELEYAGAVAGVASVLGHIFPFYLRFKGGKGFASYVGMTIALNWKFAIVVLVLGVVVTLVTDYIVAATTTTIFVVPAYLGYTSGSWVLALILLTGTAVMVYKHRENYVRIWNGTEIGLRAGGGGKHRVK